MAGSLAVALVASVAAGWWWSSADDSTAGTGGVPLDVVGSPTLGTNPALRGERLPSAAVTDLSGAPVDTADLVGSLLVVNVWGSTCAPCAKELPAFAEAHRLYGDRIDFVGISYLAASEREESFARDLGVEYELLYDGNGTFISESGITAFPVTLFVAADGTILEQTGALDADRLRSIIEGMLA